MATNFYFQSGNTSGTTNEQRLLEDLIIESIKIYGHDVYYMPRTTVKQDNILGEDILSRFDNAYPIEMYLSNIDGWEGDGELLSKFGIQVTHQATFVVSKRRWEDVVGAVDESFLQLPNRPAEGDLLYFPKTNSLFEIKFVQHLDPFFQLGKFHVYSMQCELYQYSSEALDTGVEEIDRLEDIRSQDIFGYQILTQSGDLLLTQNEFSVIQQTFASRNNIPSADNDEFESTGSGILDFTVINPFGEF